MHKISIIFLFLPLLFCSKNDFVIINQPIETRTTQRLESGYHLIRSIHCDVYILALTPQQLNSFLKKNNINPPKTANFKRELQRNVFFAIKLKNTHSNPITISRIYTLHSEQTFDSLSSLDIDENNFYKKLSEYRRIISPDYEHETLFPEESIPYYLNFITPGDEIITIIGFPRKATAHAQYTLNLDLNIMGFKRNISFDIKRSTYRTKDKDFKFGHIQYAPTNGKLL